MLSAEKALIKKKYWPQFRLDKLDDGRLCWLGSVSAKHIRKNSIWYLQVVYDNNHPHNNAEGTSIKVYSIEPELESIQRELGHIPYTKRDSSGYLFISLTDILSFQTDDINTSAASAISWAGKDYATYFL